MKGIWLKLAIVASLIVFGCLAAKSQTTVITASHIVGDDAKPLAQGEIDYLAVTLAGNPIQPQLGGGGMILYKAAKCLIVNGAITTAVGGSPCTLADTHLSNQRYFCYKAQVRDTSVTPNALFPWIPCLQPFGDTWNQDTGYVPANQPTALVQIGPQGPAGPPGTGGSSSLFGSGAPTATCSPTNLHQFYYDTANDYQYYNCIALPGPTFVWDGPFGGTSSDIVASAYGQLAVYSGAGTSQQVQGFPVSGLYFNGSNLTAGFLGHGAPALTCDAAHAYTKYYDLDHLGSEYSCFAIDGGTGFAWQQTTGGGGGTDTNAVHYNTPGINYVFTAASTLIVADACLTAGNLQDNVTSYSITSNVITVNWTGNAPNVGDALMGQLFPTSTFLNGQTFIVATVGSGTWTAPFTHANTSGTVTEAGVMGCAGNVPSQVSQMEFFKGHGNVVNTAVAGTTIDDIVSNYSTWIHPYLVSNPGSWLYILPTGNDLTGLSCPSAASREALYDNLMAAAHADGAFVEMMTPVGTLSNPIWCPTANAIYKSMTAYIRGDGKNPGNQASGKYWDKLVTTDGVFQNSGDGNLVQQSGSLAGHLTGGGARLMAEMIHQSMASKTSVIVTNIQDAGAPSSLCGVNNLPCTNAPNGFVGLNTFTTDAPNHVASIDRGSTGTGLTPALAQATVNSGTASAAFGSNVTAGNSVVAFCRSWNFADYPAGSVTDSQGNTYVTAMSVRMGANGGQAVFVAPITSSGPDTVTCNAGSGTAGAATIQEWTNIAAVSPVDVTGTFIGASSGSGTDTLNLTTSSNDIVFNLWMSAGGVPYDTLAISSPFTVNYTNTGSFVIATSTSSAGVRGGTWTYATSHTAGNYDMGAFALKTQVSTPQSAHLHEWQAADGTPLSWINPDGSLHVPGCVGCSSSSMVYPTFTGLTKFNGTTWSTPTYADVLALFSSCNSSTPYMKYDGTCGTGGSGGTTISLPTSGAQSSMTFSGEVPLLLSDASGSGTSQTATSTPTFTPGNGNCWTYKTTTANTTTALTVSINSLSKSVAIPSVAGTGFTTTLATSPASIPAGKPMKMCYDGTNYNVTGTGITPSAGTSVYPAQMAMVAGASMSSATVGPTPLAGSLQVFNNGAIMKPGYDWTLSGSTVTFSPSIASTNTVIAQWLSATSATGGFAANYATVRGNVVVQGANATTVLTLPGGSQVGDTVIAFWESNAADWASPTGTWTAVPGANIGLEHSVYYSRQYSHDLTSADITAGNITIPANASGGWGFGALVVFAGTHQIREAAEPPDCFDDGGTFTISTSANAASTDTLYWWGSNEGSSGTANSSSTSGATTIGTVVSHVPNFGLFQKAAPVSNGVNNVSVTINAGGTCGTRGYIVVR